MADRSDPGEVGSCHLFLHADATLMLEFGADILHVQEQLGRACFPTTQFHALSFIRKLTKVYAATHPGGDVVAAG